MLKTNVLFYFSESIVISVFMGGMQMRLRRLKNVSCFIVMFCMVFSSVICVKAADRVSWNKKMINGGSIFYWVSSDVIYASNIRGGNRN